MQNTRLASDIFVTATFDVRDPDNTGIIDMQLLNNTDSATDTHLLHGSVMTLPVSLGALAHPVDLDGNERDPFISAGHTSFAYWIESLAPDSEFGDSVASPTAPLRADFVSPALTAFTSDGSPMALDQPGQELSIKADVSKIRGNPQLLLLHHLNMVAKSAEVVPVLRTSRTSLTVTPTTLIKGRSATATVTVTDAGSPGPGGKVELYDGSRLIATKSIPYGSATFTVSGLSAGVHRIQARYPGSNRYAPSTSRTVQVVVTG